MSEKSGDEDEVDDDIHVILDDGARGKQRQAFLSLLLFFRRIVVAVGFRS